MGEGKRPTGDGWEVHRRDQLRREALATPMQRLRWLEDAITFAHRAGALPQPTSPPGATSDEPSPRS